MDRTRGGLRLLSYLDVGATVFAILILIVIGSTYASSPVPCTLGTDAIYSAINVELLWPSGQSSLVSGQKALFMCKDPGFGHFTCECQDTGILAAPTRGCEEQPPVGIASAIGIAAFTLTFVLSLYVFIHSYFMRLVGRDIVVDDKEK